MAILAPFRVGCNIICTLITLAAIGFVLSAIFSSAWQIMDIFGTGELHMHGLWFDYVYTEPHLAEPGPNTYQWIFSYKLGSAVYGDEAHRAQPYQLNTLVLLCASTMLASIAALLSYCASMKIYLAISLAICLLISTILTGAALGSFYINAMLPQNRFEYTDRLVMQTIGYAFWRGLVGAIGFALATIFSMVVALLIFFSNRNKKNPETVKYSVWTPSSTLQRTYVPAKPAEKEIILLPPTRSPASSAHSDHKQTSPIIDKVDKEYVEYRAEPHRLHHGSASSQQGDVYSEYSSKTRRLSQEVATTAVMPLYCEIPLKNEQPTGGGHHSFV